ncbi:unnamed protein product [Caenorhabditis nigoni]
MGACDGADMSKKVMCCPGIMQVIILGGIFFLSSLTFGGLFYWQVDKYIKFLEEVHRMMNLTPEMDIKLFWTLMAVPGLMLLSAMCSLAMIKINPKLLLVICTAWPVCSSLVPAVVLFLVVMVFKDQFEKFSTKGALDMYNDRELYIIYIVPAGCVVYIICAIYCVVLLVCLGCCQRAGAGRDMYDLEAENDDEDHETISESPIIFE